MSSRLLVVEDDVLIQMTLVMFLEDAGLDVQAAVETASDAERLALQHRPDLILMDVNLGDGRDGISAATTIRARDPEVSIVFLTAHADELSLERMKAVNPAAIVSKPYDSFQLIRTITDALRDAG